MNFFFFFAGKSYSIRPRYSTFKHFRVWSASDEIRSAYAQCALKFIPLMLTMDVHCTCQNCSHFTAGWVCTKISSSYAQCSFIHIIYWRKPFKTQYTKLCDHHLTIMRNTILHYSAITFFIYRRQVIIFFWFKNSPFWYPNIASLHSIIRTRGSF